MDTSPIRHNPHVSPVSPSPGPTRTTGTSTRYDAVHSRSWQTSVPLMQRAPTALDLSALRDLVTHLAETDEGFKTPMALLADKIDETDNQKLLQNFSSFRKELFTLLLPETLRDNPAYLEAYRKFLGRYRDCSLCSTVTLKNSQGDNAKIDKLLICAASIVIDNAFETGWAECKVGIFLSDEMNEDFFTHVVESVKTGAPPAAPEGLERLVDRYTGAHALGMLHVLRDCQSILMQWKQPIDKRKFHSLWSLAEKYQDGFLKAFCLAYLNASPSDEILESRSVEQQQLQKDLERLESCLVLNPSEVALTVLNAEVLQICQKLHVKAARITCPLGSDQRVLEGLKQFHKLVVDDSGIFELLQGNSQLTDLVYPADATPAQFSSILSENRTLKRLTFRSLSISSEEELILLVSCLQKNQVLSILKGLSEKDAERVKEALINGQYERSVKLRF